MISLSVVSLSAFQRIIEMSRLVWLGTGKVESHPPGHSTLIIEFNVRLALAI